jgi:hypothetical protein
MLLGSGTARVRRTCGYHSNVTPANSQTCHAAIGQKITGCQMVVRIRDDSYYVAIEIDVITKTIGGPKLSACGLSRPAR